MVGKETESGMIIGFKNFGTKDRPCIALTFCGRPFGDSKKHSSWESARGEAQMYFDGNRGEVGVKYTLDTTSLMAVM